MSLRHNTHDATRNALRTRYVLGDMLGQSPQMEQVRQTILLYARSSAAVLIEGETPLVRFIGSDDMQQNREFFADWLKKLPLWEQATTPYLFLHTPDIAQAPELVDTLWQDLQDVLPDIGTAPSIPQQSSLF